MQPEDKLEECLNSSIKNTFEVEGRTMNITQFFKFMDRLCNLFCQAFLRGERGEVQRLVPIVAKKIDILLLHHECLRSMC